MIRILIKEQIVEILNKKSNISLEKAKKEIPNLTKSYFYKIKKEWKKKQSPIIQSNRKKNYKYEIITILLTNPSGLTIKDISDILNASRNTISKYIGILEAEKKVISKQIGAYKLYYSAERSLIPKRIMLAYYSGLLTSLKREILDKDKYKEIGKTIADFIAFAYTFSFPENVDLKKGPDYSNYFKNFSRILTYIDFIYETKPKIKIEPLEKGAIFNISEIDLIDKSKELDYHYYIASGVIEKLVSRDLGKEILCNVLNIDTDQNTVKIEIIVKE